MASVYDVPWLAAQQRGAKPPLLAYIRGCMICESHTGLALIFPKDCYTCLFMCNNPAGHF
jgi:hypothetical protein